MLLQISGLFFVVVKMEVFGGGTEGNHDNSSELFIAIRLQLPSGIIKGYFINS